MAKSKALARLSARNHKKSQNLTNLAPPPPPPPQKKSGYGHVHYRSVLFPHECTYKDDILQARSQAFLCVCVVGRGQIGQILGPFMITRGLCCDRVGFGHFGKEGGGGGGGGSDDPPLPTQSYLTTCYASRHYASAISYLHLVFIRYFRLLVLLVP